MNFIFAIFIWFTEYYFFINRLTDSIFYIFSIRNIFYKAKDITKNEVKKNQDLSNFNTKQILRFNQITFFTGK